MSGDSRTYHHGDLRAALLEAGLLLAREGGIGALGLREATRSVGVTPNAAYRHFADLRDLTFAVAEVTQQSLADAMKARIDVEATSQDAAHRSVQRLRGAGLGYIDFAVTEPGWFELAILTHDANDDGPSVTTAGVVPPPFRLLTEALDGMVAAGALDPQRREHAEWPCWSTVHGFAEIASHGPLQGQPSAVLGSLAALVVDTIIRGLGVETSPGRDGAPGR